MGVLAPPESRTAPTHLRSQLPVYCAATLYAVVVAATVAHHEPWADEAQSWLLARDSGLFELWTKLLHYEGTPGLWHTLLHVLIRLGLPYASLNIFSGLLGVVGAWLLLRYGPLPLSIKLLLPFTYFLCYQYAVVARSYSLLPALLFACAIVYHGAERRPWLFTALLSFMAAVSVHAFALSFAICIGWYFSAADRRKLVTATATYVLVAILVAASAWPAQDVAFITHFDLSLDHLAQVSAVTFCDAFTGQWFASAAAVLFSVPFLWRGGGLLIFVLSSALLCGLAAVVYTQVWHEGLLFLVWLFALWIAAVNAKVTAPVIAALVIVIVFQCYWTIKSVRYDWAYPYSGAAEAARFLHERDIPKQRLYGIGYSCTAIQPYFPRNIFVNFNQGKPRAFWDWSTRNHTNDVTDNLFSQKAEYVVVGYKRALEKTYWANLTAMSGYQAIKHFEGNLFWRTSVLEPESFDLYQRAGPGYDSHSTSTISMTDPNTAHQLLSGFYGLESGAWRWTAREFVVALKRPARSEHNGARLVLNLFIPDLQIQRLGPMTLRADVAGHLIEPQVFVKAGQHTYSRDLPAGALQSDTVPVHFSFDKAPPPSASDARELGAVVKSVSLQPK